MKAVDTTVVAGSTVDEDPHDFDLTLGRPWPILALTLTRVHSVHDLNL